MQLFLERAEEAEPEPVEPGGYIPPGGDDVGRGE